MNNDFYNTYHRYTQAPRTMDEAYKTAEYCSPITIYRKTMSTDLRATLDLAGWFIMTGLFVGFWMGFFKWLST